MTNTVIKGNGTSQTLRIPADALSRYPDLNSMLQDMIQGTFQIDIGNLVPSGVNTMGTPLNKANLLSDATERAIWGSTGNRTVDQALNQLRTLITTAQTAAQNAQAAAETAQAAAEAAQTAAEKADESTFQKLVTGRLI